MRKPSNNDMENIAEDAEAAFWAVVAKAGKKYGATSGDMDPGAAFKFEHECMAAVKIWFEYNLNESTDHGSRDINAPVKSFEEFSESVLRDSRRMFPNVEAMFGINLASGKNTPTMEEAKIAMRIEKSKIPSYAKAKLGVTQNKDNGYAAIINYLEHISKGGK